MARPESAFNKRRCAPQAANCASTREETGYSCQLSGALNFKTRDTTQNNRLPTVARVSKYSVKQCVVF
jgi:hypothetical protein